MYYFYRLSAWLLNVCMLALYGLSLLGVYAQFTAPSFNLWLVVLSVGPTALAVWAMNLSHEAHMKANRLRYRY